MAKATWSFTKWMFVSGLTWAASQVVVVGVIDLFLGLSLPRLLLPLLLLISSGLVFSILIYWARAPFDRPLAVPLRSVIAIFVGSLMYSSALTIGAIHTGIISRSTALYDCGPAILVGSIITSASTYFRINKPSNIK